MLVGFLNGHVKIVDFSLKYWNLEPELELSIRSNCRTGPKNHIMLEISFYSSRFSNCHKTNFDLNSSLLPSSSSFIWLFRVFIVYHILTLTLSTFSKFFSHFFSTIFFLYSVELLVLLHQLVLFIASSCPFIFYWPRYYFLSMILLDVRLMCLFILWKDVFSQFK
jgi:hypothetical protein